MENQSLYDPSRKTIGAIYRDALINNKEDRIEVGDMNREITSSLVEDINDTLSLGTKKFEGLPFYILILDQKDLQMKTVWKRRIFTQKWLPYPEDDTLVFYHDPKIFKTYFCWCLPHHTEIDNTLSNSSLFDPNWIEELRAWKRVDLYRFGFMKDEMGNWVANPNFKFKEMEEPKIQILKPLI